MMNNMMKRVILTAVTGSVLIGAALTAYAAPAGNRPQGRQMQGMQQQGERPELPEGVTEGERPELPEGAIEGERPELPEGMKEGERPELPEGMEEGERPELPEGVTEEDADPAGGRQGKKGERCSDGGPKGDMVNIEAYKEALEGVEDDETKASLQEYIDALEAALDDERSALDSKEEKTDDEMQSYREAVADAAKALKAAFEEAGVEVSDEGVLPDEDELPAGAAGNKKIEKTDKQDADNTVSGSTAESDANKNAGKTVSDATEKVKKSGDKNAFTNKLSELYNWLKGIFG